MEETQVKDGVGMKMIAQPKTARDVFDDILLKAEQRFGKRSRDLAISVEPRDHKTPESIAIGTNGCVVHYFRAVEVDSQRLRFQLSHEAIHVLSGNFRRDVPIIEEGLAVSFSLSVMDRNYRRRSKKGDGLSPLFINALSLFDELKSGDDSIRQLRLKCPDLDQVTPTLLISVFSCSMSLASKLCQRVPQDMHLR
jgi:hypothetical protein